MFESLIQSVQYLVSGLNAWITATLHGNVLVAGAVTASIAGSLFYVLRKVPVNLWLLAKKKLFFTYKLEYQEVDTSAMYVTPLQKLAGSLELGIQKNIADKRSVVSLVLRNTKLSISLASGIFYFKWNGIIVQVNRDINRSEKRSSGMVTLSITTFWPYRCRLLDNLKSLTTTTSRNAVFQIGEQEHRSIGVRRSDLIKPPVLALNTNVKEKIDKAIENFIVNRPRNLREGNKNKLTILLYGEPGTGKSSIAEYIAYKLDTSLVVYNASSIEECNINLGKVVLLAKECVSEESFPVILCDDIETIWTLLPRKPLSVEEASKPYRVELQSHVGSILTDLQSPTEINDCIVVITTNHLEQLDPAIYRPGRVNLLLEVGRLDPRCIKEYYTLRYNQQWPEHVVIERSLRGCDISDYYEQNPTNPQGFVDAVITPSDNDLAFQAKLSQEKEIA